VAYGAVSLAFLGVALLAVVAAMSLYVYEHPHHHCPFCLLKREYGYIGFVLYAPLFAGAACGLAAGALSWRPPASLQAWLPTLTQRLRPGRCWASCSSAPCGQGCWSGALHCAQLGGQARESALSATFTRVPVLSSGSSA
jgi:hypothetical protein